MGHTIKLRYFTVQCFPGMHTTTAYRKLESCNVCAVHVMGRSRELLLKGKDQYG